MLEYNGRMSPVHFVMYFALTLPWIALLFFIREKIGWIFVICVPFYITLVCYPGTYNPFDGELINLCLYAIPLTLAAIFCFLLEAKKAGK